MDSWFLEIAKRIETQSLQVDDRPTRALVVFNTGAEPGQGRVRFAAMFPMRREACPQPVTVREKAGRIVPSRLTVSEIEEGTDLPPGRVLWKMELEFVVNAVPEDGWRTYAATFERSPESRSDDRAFFEALPLLPLHVQETDCHSGDLPRIGSLSRYSGGDNMPRNGSA